MFIFYSFIITFSLAVFFLYEPDQRRMVEIIGHLTKMRFGDQEQSKAKDTKEVSACSCSDMSFSIRILEMCRFF